MMSHNPLRLDLLFRELLDVVVEFGILLIAQLFLRLEAFRLVGADRSRVL